jgi:hypothetical protein
MRRLMPRTVGGLAFLCVMGLLAGCTPKEGALPVVVTVDALGWATVSFPVCEHSVVGTVNARVSVADGHQNALQSDDDHFFTDLQGHVRDEVFAAVVNPETLRSGEMVPGLPVTSGVHAQAGEELDPSGVTFRVAAGLYGSSLVLSDFEGPGTWLVRTDGHHDEPADIVSTTESAGLAEIGHFCSDLREASTR